MCGSAFALIISSTHSVWPVLCMGFTSRAFGRGILGLWGFGFWVSGFRAWSLGLFGVGSSGLGLLGFRGLRGLGLRV